MISRRDGIWASLLRPTMLFALCGAGALVLLAFALIGQRDWRQRADSLRRENMELRLAHVSQEVADAAARLAAATRELASSESMLQVVQGNPAADLDPQALERLAPRGIDSLLVVSSNQTMRFSTEPDAALAAFVESVATQRAPALILAGGRWMTAEPILSRAPAGGVLGWVAAARAVSPSLIADLARPPAGSVSAGPPENFAADGLPDDARRPVAAPANHGFAMTTHVSRDAASGFVALRDAGGRTVWILRLAQSSAGDRGGTGAYVPAALLILLAIVVATTMAVKRHFRHQRSVDSRYKALIDQANDGIVIVDTATSQVLYTNPAFLNRLGYTHEEGRALTLADIFADGAGSADSALARLKDANSWMALNMQQRCKNGGLIETEVRCNTLDVDGRDVLAYVTHDVSLRRKAEQQLIENQQRLDRMAHHDQLTGLPNRHYLTAFLPEAIAEAKAANTMLGVVFLDLDRFKHINDTRGHETGDKLLQEVAGRLRTCVCDSDVVIRMGGDEFVVVFRNVKSYDEVIQGAGRIVETLHHPIVIDRHPLQTTGSVGVSLYPRDGVDMVELLKHSDTAMYQAKDRGRNNVQMFSHIMNRKLKHRVAVEASLREALRLKQLDVHYQPFVNLLTRKIVGFEALMRWNHPVHGLVPPDQFIPVAEETGLIVPMGNFVLHRTLQTMAAWRAAGVGLVPVSLNVAPAQLQRGELQATISKLLNTHGLRPELLQLEMTERVMFDSHAGAGENRQDTMAKLRDLGIKIAIDDFGTGYSSLSYLKNWRVDALKIDRSFVRDLVTDSSDLAIVSAIIAIARHLQIQVVAEGVEAYQQAEILRRLGCAVGQGFLFARPMPAAQCLELLRANAEPMKEEDEDMLAVLSAGNA